MINTSTICFNCNADREIRGGFVLENAIHKGTEVYYVQATLECNHKKRVAMSPANYGHIKARVVV